MISGLLLALFSLGQIEPSGEIACLLAPTDAGRRVAVVDLSTDAVRPVGRGSCDGAPVWSPDGRHLAFDSAVEGGRAICVAHVDSGELEILKRRHEWNAGPRWSPKGDRIAYTAHGVGKLAPSLIVYDIKTETESAWGGDPAPLMRPAWLGEHIAEALLGEPIGLIALGFTQGDGVTTDIFVVNEKEAKPLPQKALPSAGSYFEWSVQPSPDGRDLAFESNDGGDREIFVLSIEKGALDVSNHRAADWNPVWSPDGEWLAFESFRSGRRGVYRVYPATARVYPVAASAEHDSWAPSWSPDGHWLAFVSNRGGTPEVYVSDVSGKKLHAVAASAGPKLAPAWRPRRE